LSHTSHCGWRYALLLCFIAALTANAQPPTAVVLLSNVSGSAEAAAPVERAIAEALAKRGDRRERRGRRVLPRRTSHPLPRLLPPDVLAALCESA
jgi:hypothetical protein